MGMFPSGKNTGHPAALPAERILMDELLERDLEIAALLRQRATLVMMLELACPRQAVVLSDGMVSLVPKGAG